MIKMVLKNEQRDVQNHIKSKNTTTQRSLVLPGIADFNAKVISNLCHKLQRRHSHLGKFQCSLSVNCLAIIQEPEKEVQRWTRTHTPQKNQRRNEQGRWKRTSQGGQKTE
jgi:hypothetical protein